MLRTAFFSLTLGLFATVSAFAQVPKPALPAPIDSALDRVTDLRESRADKRFTRPTGLPQAGEIMVDCSLPAGPLNSINGALAKVNPAAVNTIRVSGTCKENVTVQGFENLTLIANLGASINDPSSGNLDVLDVSDTHEFSLQGFTINGGASGVVCFDYSLCRFNNNTIQGSAGDGVLVVRSQAFLQGGSIQNNGGRGLAVINGGIAAAAGVTLQGNAAAGAIANVGGHLTMANLTSQNNGGAGIRIGSHSTLRLIDSTLTGNGGAGVRIDSSSEARFDTNITGNVITGNGANGVLLFDLSFALFAGADNITGNNLGNPGGFDVFCGPQFSATRGALSSVGGGTSNCVEP